MIFRRLAAARVSSALIALAICSCSTTRSVTLENPTPPLPAPALDNELSARPLAVSRQATPVTTPWWPRFGLSAGGAFLGDFTTTLRVDGPNLGEGAEIGLENTLGFDNTIQSVRLDGFWRITRRNRLELSWFTINRSSTKTLSQDIQIGDTVFPAGTALAAVFNTQIVKFSYAFNFVARDTWELGATLGLHTMAIETGFASTVGALNETVDVVAPLPLLGLRYEQTWAQRWRLHAWVQALYLEFKTGTDGVGFDGLLLDTILKAEYSVTENIALGLGYNGFLIDLGVGGDDRRLSMEYAYHGGLFFLTIYG